MAVRPARSTCFFLARPGREAGRRPPWPWAVYPLTGSVEVVFQHLRTRPPFDDPQARDEFRQLCNRIPGVQLPKAKLDVRPSFPLSVLAGPAAVAAAQSALEWFITTANQPTSETS